MAKLIIKLDKDDIKISRLGDVYLLNCQNDIDVILTKDAYDELYSDYLQLMKEEDVSGKNSPPKETKL